MAVTVLTDGSTAQDSRTLTWTIPTLAAGDVVVVPEITWDNGYTMNAPTGTGLSFTQPSGFPAAGAGHTTAYMWTATASSGGTDVVVTSSVLAGGSSVHNGVLYVFPAADGYSLAGTPNTLVSLLAGGATATGSLTGTTGNAAVVAEGDWTGSSGASRAWSGTPTEDLYINSAGNSTHYFSRYTLTGTSTTVGLTAPSTGSTFTLVGLEIIYTAPGGINGHILLENGDRILSESGTDLLVSEDFVPSSPSASATLNATASTTATGGVGTVVDTTLSATAATTSTGIVGKAAAATLAVAVAITAVGVVGMATGTTLSETATVTATGSVGTSATASLNATGTITATGSVSGSGASASATLSATAATTAAGAVGTSRTTSLPATATIAATGVVGRNTSASITATGTLATAGQVGARSLASINAAAQLFASGTLGVSRTSSLTATVTITTTGNVAELAGDTPPERTLDIPTDDRTIEVEAEMHMLVIPAEQRTLVVPPENRTLEA